MEALLLPSGPGCVALTQCQSFQSPFSKTAGDRVCLRSSRSLVVPLNIKCPSLQNSVRRRRNNVVAETETETETAVEEEVAQVSGAATVSEEVIRSVELLKTAAKTRNVSAQEICAAFRILDKAKLDRSNYASIIGATESPGRTWMLVFAVNKNLYNNRPEGGGFFFPITAVQNFDTAGSRLENGIYLRSIGSLTFSGKIKFDKRKLSFFVNILNLTFSSWGPLRIKLGSKGDNEVPD